MKKFFTVLFLLVAFAVTMFPITTAYASAQTVECSWWGKMIHGEYSKGKEAEIRRRQQQEQWRRQQEQRRRRQQQQYYEQQRRRQQQQRSY